MSIRVALIAETIDLSSSVSGFLGHQIVNALGGAPTELLVITSPETSLLPSTHRQVVSALEWRWTPKLMQTLLQFQPEVIHCIEPAKSGFAQMGFQLFMQVLTAPFIRAKTILSILGYCEEHSYLKFVGNYSQVFIHHPEILKETRPPHYLRPNWSLRLEHYPFETIAKPYAFMPGTPQDHRDLKHSQKVCLEYLSENPEARLIFGGNWQSLAPHLRKDFLDPFLHKKLADRLMQPQLFCADQQAFWAEHADLLLAGSVNSNSPSWALAYSTHFRKISLDQMANELSRYYRAVDGHQGPA